MHNVQQLLGFGCSSLTSIKSHQSALKILDAAYRLGVSHFDTAPLYGQGYSEKILGCFIKKKREGVSITTKFGLGNHAARTIPVWLALPLNYYKKKLYKSLHSSVPIQTDKDSEMPFRP